MSVRVSDVTHAVAIKAPMNPQTLDWILVVQGHVAANPT
jgi:hypothetical protein